MSEQGTSGGIGGAGGSVAIFPYSRKPSLRIARQPLAGLLWPLGAPDIAAGAVAGDLGPNDHLIFYPSRQLFAQPLPGLKARISVMFAEPESWQPMMFRLARWQHKRFFRILTVNPRLLAAAPNAAFFPFGSTWVPDWQQIDCTKTRMLSLIASKKRSLPGHRLRHTLAAWLRDTGQDAAIIGRGYLPFAHKAEGLAPFRYSLIIENAREPGYFTEKLVDAMLCNTVPIYWGAPDIAKFFDPRGMIVCESEADMRAAVARISAADYEGRLPYLAANRTAAVEFAAFERRAAQIVADAGVQAAAAPVTG